MDDKIWTKVLNNTKMVEIHHLKRKQQHKLLFRTKYMNREAYKRKINTWKRQISRQENRDTDKQKSKSEWRRHYILPASSSKSTQKLQQCHTFLTWQTDFFPSFPVAPPHTQTPPFHHFLEEWGATKPYPSDTMEYKRQGIHARLLSKPRREQTMYRIHFFSSLSSRWQYNFFFQPFQFRANIRKIRRKYYLTGLVLHWFQNLFLEVLEQVNGRVCLAWPRC